MKDEAFVALKPLADPGVYVGGIVVEDDVHEVLPWDLGMDGVQEADELVVAMALHVSADSLFHRGR